jgi:hypothetical protein
MGPLNMPLPAAPPKTFGEILSYEKAPVLAEQGGSSDKSAKLGSFMATSQYIPDQMMSSPLVQNDFMGYLGQLPKGYSPNTGQMPFIYSVVKVLQDNV